MPALSIERILDRVERELAHLRASGRVSESVMDRAESLLVTQLSVSNGTRPIRVTAHADGSRSYRVASGSKLDRRYTVSGDCRECDCPAAVPCYHKAACYVMNRVLFPVHSPGGVPCDGCGECHPIRELTEIEEDDPRFLGGGPLAHQVGDLLCGECFGVAA